jgi:hypothetical protein
MHRQSSIPYWGSSLASAAVLGLLVTSVGPGAFILIWICIASLYP